MTNHLWQSTLFAVVAGLLTVALRKNRAQVRYWLWLSASLKFFVPFALLMSLGSELDWAPAAKTVAAPAVTFAIEQIAQPFPEALPFAPSTTDWTPTLFLGVWLCGVAAIVLIRFRGWLRIGSAVRASTAMDIPLPVEVRSSPGLLEPGVVGLFRPILLLPAGIEKHITPLQLDAVLAHELCHVRRRDNLTSAIHMVVEAVFWFHPLVWWISARLVEERERACDEEVLRLGGDPRVYAEGILNVCKLYVESPLTCVSGVTGSNLKKRIEAIMINRDVLKLTFYKQVVLAGAGIVALALPIAVGMLAQSPGAVRGKFEVASIKPCAPSPGGGKSKEGNPGGTASPGRLNLCNTVAFFINSAYVRFADGDSRLPQLVPIEGGPAWIRSDRYQISAKAEDETSVEMMSGPMLQALLEDRFGLKIRRETREVPVFALTVARGGTKLKPAQEGSCTPFGVAPPEPDEKPRCFSGKSGIIAGGSTVAWVSHNTSLDEFSRYMAALVGRPVIDSTGIAGMFDLNLKFLPDESTPGIVLHPPPSEGSSIFTAIQEQLGLRFESARGPGEFLVVDSVERPTEN